MEQSQKELLSVLGYFYLQTGKYKKALTLYRALMTLFPEDTYFIKTVSYLYLATGDYNKALEYADRYLQFDIAKAEKALGCFLKGKALWGLGKKEAAYQALQRFFDTEGK